MDNKVCRIHRWLTTGEHIFEVDFAENKAIGSTTGSDNSCQSPNAKGSSVSEYSSEVLLAGLESEPEEVELLVGVEDDPLIPSLDEICHTLRKGQKLWHGYVIRAHSLPSGYLLAGSLDPCILLQKIPALPQDLPRKRSIRGELRISSGSAFHFDNERPDLIAILIPLWSYIFSIRFLELQRRSIQYSPTSLSPVLAHNIKPRPGNIVLHLGYASRGLVRWLAAVLAPSMGWLVTGPLPPWAAHYSEDTRFVIATNIPCAFYPSDSPPSSHEAADLLIEFCTLFGIGSSLVSCENVIEIVPQPIAAFLAVLMLPLYGRMGLQPQLSMPRMAKTQSTLVTPPNYIRDYINDLLYFMTLSIHPDFVGSIIWSIFWEPGLDCNLVSAWFGSILEVLSPIIRAGDIEMLAKIFMARRQSPALLWAGVFFLGDMRFLQKIILYLETHDEQPGGS
ncbi:hypothetical protein DL95DRAFT_417221 [Leptodontidium sp. 2 PMI_412]|nr:hypothetical protein DL95DRAFT_417221 [Leptodontidium sp. 2 PMI_412]